MRLFLLHPDAGFPRTGQVMNREGIQSSITFTDLLSTEGMHLPGGALM